MAQIIEVRIISPPEYQTISLDDESVHSSIQYCNKLVNREYIAVPPSS
jgi:hypothetical protein